MSSELGVGIIGTGWVAGAHIDNFNMVKGCKVVAACSRDKDRAKAFLKEKGVEDGKGYGDIDKFLEHKGLDIVIIATPHHMHAQQAVKVANAGKHIVLEKPVVIEPEDLAKVVEAVNANKVKTSVCFELRWIGMFMNIKALLEQNAIGKLFYGEASYHHGIGPWYNQWGWNRQKAIGRSALLTAGCHALDGVMWFMDSRVTEVTAVGTTSPDNPLEYEYPTTTIALLKFENGAIGKVTSSIECRQPYLFPVLLQGDKGSIYNDRLSRTDWPGLDGWAHIPGEIPESGGVDTHPYAGQFRYFVECINNDTQPHNDLNATAHVHEVCFAADKSIETGGPVKIERTPGT